MASKDKKDPAWLHCQLIDGSMVCNYCKKEVGGGGIHRIKQHLANARGNIKPCLEVPDELKAEMMGLLEGYQADKAKNRKVQKEVGRNSGGIRTRFDSDPQDRMPSFEESSAFPIPGRDPYTNPREEVEHVGGSGAGASGSKRPRGNLDSFFLPRTTPGSQPTIDAKWKKIEREAAWECIARWWYDADIPFNVARSVYYQLMLDVVASCGSGFKGPGYEDIRGNLLKNEVERVKEYLTEFKESWSKTGCTIMSDGWTDQGSRTILNFLIACPKGTMFLKSVDASDQVKDANLLFRLLDEVVEEVGVQNVVQVITDNAANYVAAGKMLEEKHCTIWWTPCAAHCLDLMLEDIGKIEWVKKTVEQGKSITRYIYNHSWVLNLMRKNIDGRELVKSAITRFATNFLTLQSMIDQKANLRKMFSCDEWNASQWSKKVEAKEIVEKVFEKSFWKRAEEIVLFSAPLVKVLRMVDGDKPAMGFVYEAMDQAKEAIKEAYQGKRQKYLPLWRIIDERWNKQLHRPLHVVGYYLNPR
jgi:hypothetical protein